MKEKQKNNKKGIKYNKGITLIALVITIVILIIIAAVTINIALGQNGLVNRAKEGQEGYSAAQVEENIKLMLTEWYIDNNQNGITIKDFFENKLNDGTIDDMEETEEGYEITKDGYVITIDNNGNIVNEIAKVGPKPIVDNSSITITAQDGSEIANNSVEIGTPVKISFRVTFEEGTIESVTPNTTFDASTGIVTYITNGTEMSKKFVITGSGNAVTKKKISVANKYETLIQANSLLDAIKDNTFETSVTGVTTKIAINGKEEVYPVRVYNIDGNLTVSDTREYGEADDVATASAYAKRMVIVKVNGNLTITNTGKITATNNNADYGGPKGLLIYVTGTLTNEGEISMTARGAKAEGQDVYLFKNAAGTYECVPATGALGTTTTSNFNKAGTGRKTGGGGAGINTWSNITGTGSAGTSYSGGSGGGDAFNNNVSGTNAQPNGGSGGNGAASQGTGNPGGLDTYYWELPQGSNGTGGLLIIYANEFSNTGTINAKGVGIANRTTGGSGGASGGGSINIFYNTCNNVGTINSDGGAGSGDNSTIVNTSAGGAGTVNKGNISTGTYVAD